MQMFFRLLAVLVALGLLVGSAQAHTPSAPVVVLVDQVDDADEVGVLVTTAAPIEESRASAPLCATDAPAGYRPCVFVFRPPRTYAFN
jgi:hypothetical protein